MHEEGEADLTNREYWIMTEIFVYLHDGKDECRDENCPHCAMCARVFSMELDPKTKSLIARLREETRAALI